MKKNVFILLSLLLITALSFWFSCNIFNSQKQQAITESNILDELDGPDDVKATPPVQPDIPWTAALTTFRDTLKAGGMPNVIVNTEIDPATPANYWINSQTLAAKYITGDFRWVKVYVNAGESSVEVIKDALETHYYISPDLKGPVLYDAISKIILIKTGAAPKNEDPIIAISHIFALKTASSSDGSLLYQIKFYDTFYLAGYWTVYRRAGETTIYVVEGLLDAIP